MLSEVLQVLLRSLQALVFVLGTSLLILRVDNLDCELWISVDDEVFDIFVAAFRDEYVEQLLTVRWRWISLLFLVVVFDEYTVRLTFENARQMFRELLEDLALVKKPYQVSDFVLCEVQDVVLVEAQILHEEVDYFQSAFLDENFASTVNLKIDQFFSFVFHHVVCFSILLEEIHISDFVLAQILAFRVETLLLRCFQSGMLVVEHICLDKRRFSEDIFRLGLILNLLLGRCRRVVFSPFLGNFRLFVVLDDDDDLAGANSDVLAEEFEAAADVRRGRFEVNSVGQRVDVAQAFRDHQRTVLWVEHVLQVLNERRHKVLV